MARAFTNNIETFFSLFTDAPSPEEEEARRIAEMGKPVLGEHSRLKVIIEESTELKVGV